MLFFMVCFQPEFPVSPLSNLLGASVSQHFELFFLEASVKVMYHSRNDMWTSLRLQMI
jgi:hypothetical protein